MSRAVSARRGALALAACFVALCACGDKKDKKQGDEGADEAVPAEESPPPDKERSFLAKACEQHTDAAKKADCLCRVDVIDASLNEELLAKLETVPADGASEAVVEHLGGMANLSRVAEAMRKATNECEQGASK